MSADDGLTDDDLFLIATALAPLEMPAPAQARVLARVRARIADDAPTAPADRPSTLRTLRRDEGEWQPMAPDVDFRLLHDDGAFTSMLVRLQAGARLPPHAHAGEEHCYVVSGDIWLSGVHLEAGDFQFAGTDVVHHDIHSERGCLLHIRTSRGASAVTS